MPSRFRKNDNDFSQDLFRSAEQQRALGQLGNELRRDVLIDRSGNQLPIKHEFSRLRIDEDGMPMIETGRVGLLLDCGHMVHSLEEVLGSCRYGHTVCAKDQLYTCAVCGEKVCELDVAQLRGGATVCLDHAPNTTVDQGRGGLLGLISDTIRGLLGF